MKNQLLTGTPTSPRFALCPSTVKSGDPVLLGSIPAVALNDYSSTTGGATFYTDGTFALLVNGSSTESPFTPAAIKTGDKVYASDGTLDSTTNVTTDINLTADNADPFFGVLDPQSDPAGVGSGASTIVGVRIGDN